MLLHRNERFTPGTVFTSIGFGEWLHFVWGFYRVCLIASLWSLLFIIPGIIAMLKYSMTLFILLDHRELSVKEAMNLIGMNVGKCRLPLYDIIPTAKTVLIDKLKECGFEIK